MRYIICDRVLFVPDLNMLFLIDNREDVVTISNPARRLLELLIISQGKNVPRDEIFEKVWDDFGMVSSNNNLNHCISKLRRVLRSFGIEDEVIVTIPKFGFTLHKEVTVRAIDDGSLKPGKAPPASGRPCMADSASGTPRWPPPGRQTLFLLGAACMVLLGLFFARLPLFPRAQAETYLGTIENCKVYLHDDPGRELAQSLIMQSAHRYLSQHSVSCSKDEYLMVYSVLPETDEHGETLRLHITHCVQYRANKIALCSELSRT